MINAAFDNVAGHMQQWCRERHGYTPHPECFKGLLVAAQWLVHNAITAGMGAADRRLAKEAIEQLFYATFSGLALPAEP